MSQVVLYGRPGCHLCDDARVLLERVRAELPFELIERDIEGDQELLRRFLERIPVVTLNGEELFELFVDEQALRSHLAADFDDLESGPMSLGEPAPNRDGDIPAGERLPLGIAARLSRYLQILTQARKMGRETISSQELASYTHVNSTQIRRDLSGFGKFGKRGVGYNVDSLVAQIRKILRTAGQHNIALFGAGHLGRAIASSEIFGDHGFRVVAIFDPDSTKVGEAIGSLTVRHNDELRAVVDEQEIVVGVLAVPTHAAQQLADDLVETGVKIIFNYSEALLTVPPEVTVHTSSPAVDLLYALYFYLA
jgi:redox-sensing transcriptional repressor